MDKFDPKDGATKDISIRESSAFRKENGSWKMIAHHANDFKLWEGVVRRST